MNRRELLKTLLTVPAGTALALTDRILALDSPTLANAPDVNNSWPIDIRKDFETISWEQARRTQVYLDGKPEKYVIAASPMTGHVLCYVTNDNGTLSNSGIPIVKCGHVKLVCV